MRMEKPPSFAPAICTSQSSPSTPSAVLEGLARQASTESLDATECFPQLAKPLLQAMPYWLEVRPRGCRNAIAASDRAIARLQALVAHQPTLAPT